MKSGVNNFLMTHMNRLSDIKRRLIEETHQRFPNRAGMLSSPDQTEHMKFLVKLAKAKKGIEVGVFTGYSALCMAEGLPEDGKLIALDISEEFTSLGLKYWKEAKVDHKIDLRIGPGVDYLDKLLNDQNEVGTFDFAYVDADKDNYPKYYEKLVSLMKPGGFIMFDNMLWHQMVFEENYRNNDQDTKMIFNTNQLALNDNRVEMHTMNLADGFMVVYKK